ncbi:MAG TPA: NAD(P)/FAD-dependent oxidoreductase [Thermoanaerobacterales bacterium]|nr:NAD(P)/FAD-dependent oxidoreductase [Thermoanaerobacterales bacterium]
MKDVLVLGSGPAGYYAATLCAQNGLDVTLVEKGELGGTGFRLGALPVKILLDVVKQNPLITYEDLLKDYREKMMGVQNKLESDLERAGVGLIFGEGYFIQKDAIRVRDEIIKAKNIIIATGSRPSNPFGAVWGNSILTHEEALFITELTRPKSLASTDGGCLMASKFSMDSTNIQQGLFPPLNEVSFKNRLPKDIIILGANVEGIEFATLFSRFGVKVTVIEMMQDILPGNDSDLQQPVIETLKSFNVDFLTGEKVIKLDETDDKAIVTLENGKTLTAVKCLVCLSRAPNIPKGAEGIGIEYDGAGIKVDENFLTNVPNVYAVGDANGRCLMGSVAINQGISAALHILGREVSIQNSSYEGLPRAIFAIPEIAGVGLQEWELRQKGIKYKIAKHQFAQTWRGISKGYTEGFIKVLVDDDDRLQGIWMVGRDVSEFVGTFSILLKQKVSADIIKNSLFVHPSLSEVLLDALLRL